jgi:Chaperone of endosialidase
MNRLIQLKTTPPLLITLALLCFGLLPKAQAVVPPPDGGYPNFTTAEGHNALFNLTTGAANTAVGWFSLWGNTDGSFNTATGAGSLLFNNGDENTAFGVAALLFNSDGFGNTAVGAAALLNNTSADHNTAVGVEALTSNTGDRNTATGAAALVSNTTGFNNMANGAFALLSNTTGNENTASGVNALMSNTAGGLNTANGRDALANNSTGSSNTATGVNALAGNTAGNFNTAIGASALSGNTLGDENIALGHNAGNSVTMAANVICIGALGENVSNSCYIGQIFGATSASGTAVFINSAGKLGTSTSSRRFKEEIKPMDQASEALFALKPVTFRYRKEIDAVGTSQFGLVAEEVEKVNPALVVRDKEGKPYSVRYEQVNAMLLNEFLKEHRKNEEQQATIARQQKQIEVLAVGLQKVNAQLAAASPSRGGLELNKLAPQTALNNP